MQQLTMLTTETPRPPCENSDKGFETNANLLSITHRNSLIDGWRGLSVSLVVIGHVTLYRLSQYWDIRPLHQLVRFPVLLAENIALRLAAEIGGTGVQFFFVISGFLITKLLTVEQEKNGKISIPAFYTRRVFRIMPAFYLYLLTVLILRNSGMVNAGDDAFFRSAFYVCNLSGFKCSWWLAHTWSLSVEEQFYLIWPIAFVTLGKSREVTIFSVLIILMFLSYSIFDLTSFAHIAIGALFAMSRIANLCLTRLATTSTILIAGAALVLKPLAFQLPYVGALIVALSPLLTALVFFGTLYMRGGILLQILSSQFMRRIGLISFSVYLWQQLSLAPAYWGGSDTGAAALYGSHPTLMSLFFIPVAIVSYIAIERPMMKIGQNVSRRIIAHNISC
jgi:peptidoglycan/LPS O-acetylase OafA/YrhL